MKLEIELDLEKIDYEAINKQIQEKIAEMDLSKVYNIESKIKNQINDAIEESVNYHLQRTNWGSENLHNETRQEVRGEIHQVIQNLVSPHIDEVFNKIPKEELDKTIMEVFPVVLLELMMSQMKSSLLSFHYSSEGTLIQHVETKFTNLFRR